MDQQLQHPVVTRARILLVMLLAAFIWILLSVFGNGSPAVADDTTDSQGGLLGGLTATVEEIVPVAAITEPLKDTTDSLAKPVAPVVEPLEPVLELPMVDDTVKLLSDIVNDSTDALIGVELSDSLTFEEALTSAEALPLAVAAHEPGPVAVKATAVTPDTRAASVPAAGSLSSPNAPDAPADPIVPAPAPAPTLGQSSGAPALLASLAEAGGTLSLAVASAASADFALPSSPTFDNDSSPD